MRIGEVARAVGTTPRTIRYYEEIGLMPGAAGRAAGAHRLYSEQDVEQLAEILRLKELLGVTLDELRRLIADQEARPELREEFMSPDTSPARRRRILKELVEILERTQVLGDRRRAALDELDAELAARRASLHARLAKLGNVGQARA